MNLAFLLALLTLTLTDPTGDAIGDGTLDPPTSPIYANVAMFDLQGVDLEVSESGEAVLSVTLGALGASVAGAGEETIGDEAPAGEEEPTVSDVVDEQLRREEAGQFDVSGMLAVVDVYLDVGVGGADQTLSGPNMLLPTGSGWHHAVRISAEGAWGVTYVGASQAESLEPGTDLSGGGDGGGGASDLAGQDDGTAEPGEASEATSGEPRTLNYVPLTIVRSGNVLSMTLPWQFDPEASTDIFAMTGVHDPFSPDGWRPISQSTSPWAFSGGQQVVPVIDLLAPDSEAQVAALRSGVLPAPERASGLELPLSPWLWLMVAGLGLAIFGLILRGRVGAPGSAKAVAEESTVDVAADEEGGDVEAAEPELAFENIAGAGIPDADLAGADLAGANLAGADLVGANLAASEIAEEDGAASDIAEEDRAAADVDDLDVDVVATLLPLESDVPDALLLTDTVDEAPDQVAKNARSGFSTAVDESYLTVGDSDEDGLFGDDGADGESFWHPGSRGRKTLVESQPGAGQAVEKEQLEAEPVVNQSEAQSSPAGNLLDEPSNEDSST